MPAVKKTAGTKLTVNSHYNQIAICDTMNIMNLDGTILINNLVAADYVAARMFYSSDPKATEGHVLLYAFAHYFFEMTDYASKPEYNALAQKYTDLFAEAKQRSIRLFANDKAYGYAATFFGRLIGLDLASEFTGTSATNKFSQKFRNKDDSSIEVLQICYFIDDPEDIRALEAEDLKGEVIFIKIKKCRKYATHAGKKTLLPAPKVLSIEIGMIYKRSALSPEALASVMNDKAELNCVLFLSPEEIKKITH